MGEIVNDKNKSIVIAAIAGLTIIEAIAMLKGINGQLQMIILFIIGGLAGWVGLPQPHLKGGAKNG